MRLLIIEDDPSVILSLVQGLRDSYEVDRCRTLEEATYLCEVGHYALVILDLVLPDGDGITFCGQLRKQGFTAPIMILSARYRDEDKVAAFEAGADDYLSKPCSLKELRARLQALMRRASGTRVSEILTVGRLRLSPTTRLVTSNGVEIKLRRKEFDLLEYMMRNPGQILTRQQIINHLWDHAADTSANTVDVHIKYLRDRIDRPFGSHYIRTAFGAGYSLQPEAAKRSTPATAPG